MVCYTHKRTHIHIHRKVTITNDQKIQLNTYLEHLSTRKPKKYATHIKGVSQQMADFIFLFFFARPGRRTKVAAIFIRILRVDSNLGTIAQWISSFALQAKRISSTSDTD